MAPAGQGRAPRTPGRQASATQAPAGQAAAAQPPALPDLRIVGMQVSPDPLRAGEAATITLTVHNYATAAAGGDIAIQVVHDRGTPQPQPLARQLIHLAGDGLAEVGFELAGIELAASPYTFFAAIDVHNAIGEANEAGNAFWKRLGVCEGPAAVEVADGRDNDCSGLIDDGLDLSADPAVALGLLRQAQQRAARDRVPLAWALPQLFAPLVRFRNARLQSEEGGWVGSMSAGAGPGARGAAGVPPGAQAGGGRGAGAGRRARAPGIASGAQVLRAAAAAGDPGADWTLVDWSGGELESGDLISLRRREGDFVIVEAAGDGLLGLAATWFTRQRLFTVVKLDADEGGIVPAGRGVAVRSGDRVALVAANGRFVAAEGGGGGVLRADRREAGGWETFVLILDTPAGEVARSSSRSAAEDHRRVAAPAACSKNLGEFHGLASVC
jgi:hypothetical protein